MNDEMIGLMEDIIKRYKNINNTEIKYAREKCYEMYKIHWKCKGVVILCNKSTNNSKLIIVAQEKLEWEI